MMQNWQQMGLWSAVLYNTETFHFNIIEIVREK